MKKVITTEKKPIKLWADDIEEGALQQARNIANLPFTYKWVAVMPDGHQGYGMPIGGVLATTGVVVPNAIGVDIGCGMCAVRTSLTSINHKALQDAVKGIRERVPVGFAHHSKPQQWEGLDYAPDIPIIQQELDKAAYQLGTLGGGNHFIEIQQGSDGYIWLMLHSGSRNFGLKIAKEYHKKAQELCEMWYSELTDKDLAFLPLETPEAKEYIDAMEFALRFARANRYIMIESAKEALLDAVSSVTFDDIVNIHHNYARMEHHFGKNVLVHRKGATSARENQIGIIPGSQGTKSYIVGGKGNPESFKSCSHGAGRCMGRKEAQRTLDLGEEKRILDEQGIIHSIRENKDLDEASGAYKDISTVMANQDDLVNIMIELSPLAVVKG